MSTGPCFARAAAKAAVIWSGLLTSTPVLRLIGLTRRPCSSSARTIAAPMPREAPVTTACLDIDHHLRGALQVALHLVEAHLVLRRHQHRRATIPLLRGGAQRPVRVHQVRPREAAEVGAARGQDAVDV